MVPNPQQWQNAKKKAQNHAALRGSQIRYDEGATEIYVTEGEILAHIEVPRTYKPSRANGWLGL